MSLSLVTAQATLGITAALTRSINPALLSTGQNAGLRATQNFNTTGTPTYVQGRKAMSSGTGSIDLTALTDTIENAAVDLTGKKIQAIIFQNNAAADITISDGASNGYGMGGADMSWVIKPGQTIMIMTNNAAPTVGSGAKTIDLVGTLAQAIDFVIIAKA